MQRTPTVAGLGLLAALAFGIGNTASASTVVLTPMVPNGADEKKLMNIFHLMSSELEFMPMVDSLEEAAPRPASLTTDCVSNDACLRGIASTYGGNAVLTGVLTDQGQTLVMDLVFFEDGRIVRRKAFNVPSGATQIANAMTGILKEIMTGQGAAAQAKAAPPSADTFNNALDDDEDFFTGSAPAPAPAPAAGGFDGLVDAGPSQAELAYRAQQEEQQRLAQEQARRAAEEQARRAAEEQARRRAEEEARRRAEEEARQRAEAEARRRAEDEARRRAEEDARRAAEEQARRAAEDQARRAAEEQARQLAQQQEMERKRVENERRMQEEAARRAAEEQARQQAANNAMSSAPAPNNMGTISFANSASEISAEDINSVIQFGAPSGGTPAPAPASNTYSPTSYSPPAPAPTYQQPAANTYQPPATNTYQQPATNTYQQPAANTYQQPATNTYQPAPTPAPAYGAPAPAATNYGAAATPADLALEEQELAAMEDPGILDLDSDDKKRKKGNKKSSSSTTLDRATPKTLQLSVRGGYSRYFAFNFITAGAEVGVPLSKGLMAVAGLEAYSVQRELPPEAQIPGQPIYQWNTIYPMNVGLMYKFNTGTIAVPYVGADGIFVQYYKDEVGADWAGGARLRGGLDVMLSKNFGLNANIAVGGWSGKNWTLIEPTIGNSGLLPQINAGTVVAF